MNAGIDNTENMKLATTNWLATLRLPPHRSTRIGIAVIGDATPCNMTIRPTVKSGRSQSNRARNTSGKNVLRHGKLDHVSCVPLAAVVRFMHQVGTDVATEYQHEERSCSGSHDSHNSDQAIGVVLYFGLESAARNLSLCYL